MTTVSILQTFNQFQWDKESYSLRLFESVYGDSLPRFISVKHGYCSPLASYSFASEDMYYVKSVVRQPRLVVKDSQGRYLSIPFDYPFKFKVVTWGKNGKQQLGEPKNLSDVVDDNGTELTAMTYLMFENDGLVNFHIGAEESASARCGVMQAMEIYRERFLLCHSVINGKLHRSQVVMPVYVDIDVHVSTGMKQRSTDDYNTLMRGALQKLKETPDPLAGINDVYNPEIMLFRDEDSEEDAYDYVHPNGVLSLKLNQSELKHSSSQAVKSNMLAKQREKYTYFCNPDQGGNDLVDIGLPRPRPLPRTPSDTARSNVRADSIYEVPPLSDSPPPPLPPRDPIGPVCPQSSEPEGGVDSYSIVDSEHSDDHQYTSPAVDDSTNQKDESACTPESNTSGQTEASSVRSVKPVSSPPITAPKPHTHSLLTTQRREPEGYEERPKQPIENPHGQVSGIKSWADVPDDTSLIKSQADMAACLTLLGMEKYVKRFEDEQVDGDLLKELDETILKEDVGLSGLHVKKLMKFARGWRPE